MDVILVRHAHAGTKAQWHRDDGLRPLSKRGRLQADSLVKTLSVDPVSSVWTSAAIRCRQTVEPLALDRAVPVHASELLAKDAPIGALLTWLLAHENDPWVMCTHGEVFKALLAAGRDAGLITAPARVTEKGAAWRVTRGANGPPELEYLPPVPFL
ncbi:SixA phosphatase family protein [Pengzhenrongella sicca]|uniref:Histidine phosphatase family protein n=1 Tax=Pengzhenrongella sicca TaxID=2819238 RepID=A0A8A4Z9D0_9MICO|nr:phosphoglycerate mutase family protein [Pengzhenrongella sicca]QTE28085.1 histidine phosphatase family protein [Pengzhenrongella sicca]